MENMFIHNFLTEKYMIEIAYVKVQRSLPYLSFAESISSNLYSNRHTQTKYS